MGDGWIDGYVYKHGSIDAVEIDSFASHCRPGRLAGALVGRQLHMAMISLTDRYVVMHEMRRVQWALSIYSVVWC